MTTKLYFIVASDDHVGENYDLFVEATSPEEAAKLWAKHFGVDPTSPEEAAKLWAEHFGVDPTSPEEAAKLWAKHFGVEASDISITIKRAYETPAPKGVAHVHGWQDMPLHDHNPAKQEWTKL